MSGVEDTGGDFKPIPVGVYRAIIDNLEHGTSAAGNEMITATYKLNGNKEYNGRLMWDYIVLSDAAAWKYMQFLRATGVMDDDKPKGQFSLEKLIGKRVQIKVKHEPDNREDQRQPDGTMPMRARVGSVLPLAGASDDDEPEEPEDEPEDTFDESDVWTWAEIADMDLDQLKETIEDEELDVRVTSKSKVETVRAKVAAALGVEEPEDDEDEDDEDGDEPDYDSMDLAALKAEVKERGLSGAGSKKTLIKKLRKDDEEDGDPF